MRKGQCRARATAVSRFPVLRVAIRSAPPSVSSQLARVEGKDDRQHVVCEPGGKAAEAARRGLDRALGLQVECQAAAPSEKFETRYRPVAADHEEDLAPQGAHVAPWREVERDLPRDVREIPREWELDSLGAHGCDVGALSSLRA